MAFNRDDILQDSDQDYGPTKSPFDSTIENDYENKEQTIEGANVIDEYKNDPKSIGGSINSGAIIPKDMTVKLVRSDSTIAEIIIATLYAITLTFFGIFLGAWISSQNSFTILEKTATIVLGGFALIFIIIWIVLKFQQQKKGVLVSLNQLDLLKNDESQTK